jgi:hypothetical protein
MNQKYCRGTAFEVGEGVATAPDCGAGDSSSFSVVGGIDADAARNSGGGGVNGLAATAAVPVGIIDRSVATVGTGSK